jgi:DNA-binding MarR family transcriptional regulator
MQIRSNVIADQIESALRRIVRSMDLHSRAMVQRNGLTSPQAALMKALSLGPLTAGDLANRINLSQGTVTDILKRLETRGLVHRLRDEADKRRVIVSLTEQGQGVINSSAGQLQAPFSERLNDLPEWEQSQLLAALQRVAHMMESPVQARIVLQAPEVEDVVVQPAPVSADDLRPGEH